jgi:hypothetical protein
MRKMSSIFLALTSSLREVASRRAARYIGIGLVLLLVLVISLDVGLGGSVSTTTAHHAPIATGVAWGR